MVLLLALLGCVGTPVPEAPPVAPRVAPPAVEPQLPPAFSPEGAWALRGAEGAVVDPTERLVEVPCPEVDAAADPEALARLAGEVLAWRARHPEAGGGLLGSVPAVWLDEALRRVAAGEASDDTRAAAFRCVAWKPDRQAAATRNIALPDDRIRLTHYLAWRVEGRAQPEPPFTTPLYALPDDERGLPAGELERRDLLRERYTRREVLDGVYLEGGEAEGRAEPLIWLARAAVHEALLQGTVVVRLPDGSERTYNVHRNNGRPWNPAAASTPEAQERFWYFREVPGLLGYGDDEKIVVEPRVTVAGDVPNLGLGVPILLHWEENGRQVGRVVLLADTGGAFQPNLFQLDWLVGVFPDRASFQAAAAAVPDRVHATFLVPNDRREQ